MHLTHPSGRQPVLCCRVLPLGRFRTKSTSHHVETRVETSVCWHVQVSRSRVSWGRISSIHSTTLGPFTFRTVLVSFLAGLKGSQRETDAHFGVGRSSLRFVFPRQNDTHESTKRIFVENAASRNKQGLS